MINILKVPDGVVTNCLSKASAKYSSLRLNSWDSHLLEWCDTCLGCPELTGDTSVFAIPTYMCSGAHSVLRSVAANKQRGVADSISWFNAPFEGDALCLFDSSENVHPFALDVVGYGVIPT